MVLEQYICRSHEDMSVRMIDYIVDEHNIDIDVGVLKKAKVHASPTCSENFLLRVLAKTI